MIKDKEILDFCNEYITIINDKLNEIKNRQDEFGNIINLENNKPSKQIKFAVGYKRDEINKIWKFFESDNFADIKCVVNYINSNVVKIPNFKFPKIHVETNGFYAGMIDTHDGFDYEIPYIVVFEITLIKEKL